MKCNSYFEYSNGNVKCKIKVSNNAFNKRDTKFILEDLKNLGLIKYSRQNIKLNLEALL